MKVKYITGTVTTPIVLGTGQYGTRLNVTNMGAVLIPIGDGTAITAPDTVLHAVLKNAGMIEGGAGSPSNLDSASDPGQGGDGILLDAGGAIKNTGIILGGAGGTYAIKGAAGNGGGGIMVTGVGTVTNSGSISGGLGASYRHRSGAGGTGVSLAGGGTLVNHGVISGGAGGNGGNYSGDGGAAVSLGGYADLTNTGTIIGGNGGYSFPRGTAPGGVGVDFTGTGTLSNNGTISGGAYGVGVEFAGSGTLLNRGQIIGNAIGNGVNFSGNGTVINEGSIQGGMNRGMTGVDFTSAGSLINAGLVSGGSGYYSRSYVGGAGGTGVDLNVGGSINNTGTITGGDAGKSRYYTPGVGGIGVALNNGGLLINHGLIEGGAGAYSNTFASNGGVGVTLTTGSTLTNFGTIAGGAGAHGGKAGSDSAGYGGTGASVAAGDLTNYGTIIGGVGGSAKNGYAGHGGYGVYLDGGTLTAAAGLIAGGAPGTGKGGVQGRAVEFASTAATLIVDPGATFSGDIAADSNDTLALAGAQAGTLSGFGTSITGFHYISENSGANWTLDGSINNAGTLTIGGGGMLSLDGTVSITTILFAIGGEETLTLGIPTAVSSTFAGFGTADQLDLIGLQATSFNYANGTLTLMNADNNIVDTLTFSGEYTKGDFALQADGNNTNVVYVGAPSHLPDFLSGDAVGPVMTWAGLIGPESERFFSLPQEQVAPNWADLHNLHGVAR